MSWKLTYNKFKPKEEGLREALCALGNGYFVTRGAWSEAEAKDPYYPGTYMAGVYNKIGTQKAGRIIQNEDLVNCPNWLPLTFKPEGGEWASPTSVKVISYTQELDIQYGVLTRKTVFGDRQGRKTSVFTRRLAHIGDAHLAAISYCITPLNYSGKVTVRSGLDGTVQNTGIKRYRELKSKHLKPCFVRTFGSNGITLASRTSQSKITIVEAAKTRLFTKGSELKMRPHVVKEANAKISQEFTVSLKKKQSLAVEKIVSIHTSKDPGVSGYFQAAIKTVQRAGRFDNVLKSHQKAWKSHWEMLDIMIDGDEFSQKVLRLHSFHLFQSASIHNTRIDAGLAARGLTGESYRGHIFWDELYCMPFFNLRYPEISKSILMYRHRRLGEARKYARKHGYKGSMFPWQSGSTGVEETQVIHLNPLSGKWDPDSSSNQRHISFAIAYNIWKYWESTRDVDFMVHFGAEVLLSIAQFCSSLAKFNPKTERYHTERLMGPDEFHEKLPSSSKEGLKDNAYSNLMIAWTLGRAQEILLVLPQRNRSRIFQKIGLSQKELDRWEDITRRMNIVMQKGGVVSQFDGYFGLKELDWKAYRKKYGDIQRMDRILKSEGKSPDDYKLSKQADFLMIFYLLSCAGVQHVLWKMGYVFEDEMLGINYRYYEERTSHGSSLSKVVHCYIAHLLGKTRETWNWFVDALKSDIDDTQGGTTPEGIHAGVMGGTIYLAMSAFAGLRIKSDRIQINPRLPKKWQRVQFKFLYQGTLVSLAVTKHQVDIMVHGPASGLFSIPFEIAGSLHRIPSTKRYSVTYR